MQITCTALTKHGLQNACRRCTRQIRPHVLHQQLLASRRRLSEAVARIVPVVRMANVGTCSAK